MRVKGIYDSVGLESCAPIDHDYPYKLRAVLKNRATYYEAEVDDIKFSNVQNLLKKNSKDTKKALNALHDCIDLKVRYNLLVQE